MEMNNFKVFFADFISKFLNKNNNNDSINEIKNL